MPRYQIKEGFKHGKNNEYKAGDVVELSEYEAAPLYFKLIKLGPEIAPTVKTTTKDEPPAKKAGK